MNTNEIKNGIKNNNYNSNADDNVVKPRDPRGRRHSTRPDLEIGKLAQACGVTQSCMSLVMAGKRRPSLRLAEKLREALGLGSLDELLKELERYGRRQKGKRAKRAARQSGRAA